MLRALTQAGITPDLALGATTIYVLPAAVPEHTGLQPHAALIAAYRALGLILNELARRDSAAVRCPVRWLPAVTTPVSNVIDFRDTHRLVEAGYRLAQDWLTRQPAATA